MCSTCMTGSGRKSSSEEKPKFSEENHLKPNPFLTSIISEIWLIADEIVGKETEFVYSGEVNQELRGTESWRFQ